MSQADPEIQHLAARLGLWQRYAGALRSHPDLKATNSKELNRWLREKLPTLRGIMVNSLRRAAVAETQKIDSRWLSTWLCLQVADEGFLDANGVGASDTNPWPQSHSVGVAEALCGLARYAIHAYAEKPGANQTQENGWQDLIPSERLGRLVDSAQLLLLTEWAHFKGVSRAVPLYAWLNALRRPELALYALSPVGGYRQHFYHVQDVCLLGLVLLAARAGDKPLLPGGDALTADWCIAALLHDLGQLYEVLHRSAKTLGVVEAEPFVSLRKWFGVHFGETAKAFTGEFGADHTGSAALSTLPPTHHGLISGAAVSQQLKHLSDRASLLTLHQPALSAIQQHEATLGSVSIDQEPVAALLVLCDQLQCFGRARIDPDRLASDLLAAAAHDDLSDLGTRSLDGEAVLALSPCHVDDHGVVCFGDADKAVFTLDLGPTGKGSLEPAAVWIDACRRLQRIRVPNERCDIEVVHTSQTSQVPSQLQRLIAMATANSQKYGPLVDWALLASGVHGESRHEGMDYKRTEDGTERFVLRLKALGEEPALRFEPKDHYGALRALGAGKV